MNKIICRRIIASAGIFLMGCAPALSYGQTLTLYDAVHETVTNYPQIQQRLAEVSAGKAHITSVNNNRLPSLILQDEATLGTDNSLQGAYFSLGMVPSTPGNYTTPQSSPNPGNVAISFLKWEFYTFGYYNAQQKQAKSQLAINVANLNSDKYTLTENVVSLYLDWLKKFRLVQIQNENMARAEVILTAIRATVLSGLKPGVDSSTASAVYANAKINYLQALDNYISDRIMINAYSGVNGAEVAPDTSMINSSLLQQAALVPTADSVAPGHPLLQVYEKQYEEQIAANNTIAKKYLPRLGIDGAAWSRSSGISYTGAYPDNIADGIPYTRYNYLFGLNLSYDITDMKRRRDELVEGRYVAKAKQDALQNQQISLNVMIQQANSTYATTVQKLKEIPVQLYSARQAYGQQVALYKSGLNTLIDVTNAQYVLLQAETDYVIAQDELLQVLYIRAGLDGQLETFLQKFK